MTTKRTKTAPARKSAKKATPKPAAKKAPRKPVAKATPVEAPADPGPELVEYDFRGTIYQLQKDAAGYHFGDLTFKALVAFGRHLEKLHPAPDPAAESDALLEHVEQTLVKPQRSRKALPVPKEMRAPNDPRVAPGATLTRTYKGKEIRVEVTTEGFVYEGQTFRSVSAVAKHIVGYMISGPVFFRLVEPKAVAKDGE
jgi:hypothetical protein